jgi:hypothetical protein
MKHTNIEIREVGNQVKCDVCDKDYTNHADATDRSFAAPSGSAWAKINAIFKEADILEELIQLRMERPGETRDSALEWAKEKMKRHRTKL